MADFASRFYWLFIANIFTWVTPLRRVGTTRVNHLCDSWDFASRDIGKLFQSWRFWSNLNRYELIKSDGPLGMTCLAHLSLPPYRNLKQLCSSWWKTRSEMSPALGNGVGSCGLNDKRAVNFLSSLCYLKYHWILYVSGPSLPINDPFIKVVVSERNLIEMWHFGGWTTTRNDSFPETVFAMLTVCHCTAGICTA